MKNEKILGIDFGTSRTVFSMTSAEARFEPEIVEIDGKPFAETVLRLDESGDIELYGAEAWEHIDQAPERTYSEFKMGVGCDVEEFPQVSMPRGTVSRGYSPRELGILFLRRSREKIERQHFNGASMADSDILTVIGYPAAWNEKQREETLAIAREAGFPNVRGCSEPVGVIYYHHYKGELSVDSHQKMLVYDFGGGTSDVAIVQTHASGKPKMLGVGGAEDLGGRNFDAEIYKALLEQCGLDQGNIDHRDVVSLRRATQNLKEKLAAAISDGRDRVESTVTLYGLRSQKRLELSVSDFEEACRPLIERFPEPVWSALNRADVSPETVDISILAGGSARMHYVRKALDDILPNDIVLQSLNPGEVVAKGLAIYGRSLTNEKGEVFPVVSDSGQAVGAKGVSPKNEGYPVEVSKKRSRKKGGFPMNFLNRLSTRGKWAMGGSIVLIAAIVLVFLNSSPSDPIEKLRKTAEKGDVEAQFELGRMYLNGDGVPESMDQASTWFGKAAENGHVRAQYIFGLLYWGGEGVAQSYSKAIEWFQKAADQGYADAQYDLGDAYLFGRGVIESPQKAAEWYLKAAEQGHVEAQFSLALMYDEGNGIRQSYSNALKWYREAAKQGNSKAQFHLGIMHLRGLGVSESNAQAMEWFLKAAEQGQSEAQYNLGVFYENGMGVEKDPSEAYRWYYISSKMGDRDAIKKMSELVKDRFFFLGPNVSGEDATRIEREADEYIRSKGWKTN